jgi:hypothetical protein
MKKLIASIALATSLSWGFSLPSLGDLTDSLIASFINEILKEVGVLEIPGVGLVDLGDFIDCRVETAGMDADLCQVVNEELNYLSKLWQGWEAGGCKVSFSLAKYDKDWIRQLCAGRIAGNFSLYRNDGPRPIYSYDITSGERSSIAKSIFAYTDSTNVEKKIKEAVSAAYRFTAPDKLRNESPFDASILMRRECIEKLGPDVDEEKVLSYCPSTYYFKLPEDLTAFAESVKAIKDRAVDPLTGGFDQILGLKKAYAGDRPLEDASLTEKANKAKKSLGAAMAAREDLIEKGLFSDVTINYWGGESISKLPAYARNRYMELASRDIARKTLLKGVLRSEQLRDQGGYGVLDYLSRLSAQEFDYSVEFKAIEDSME